MLGFFNTKSSLIVFLLRFTFRICIICFKKTLRYLYFFYFLFIPDPKNITWLSCLFLFGNDLTSIATYAFASTRFGYELNASVAWLNYEPLECTIIIRSTHGLVSTVLEIAHKILYFVIETVCWSSHYCSANSRFKSHPLLSFCWISSKALL